MIDNPKKAARCLASRSATDRVVKSGPTAGLVLTKVPGAVLRYLRRQMRPQEGLYLAANRLGLKL